jgi:cytochrome d ubiquinol oxidase subunit I
VAFFMESTFVAVMFFGWKKVSPGFHLASTWLTGLGATISAWWILVANAWMQYPVGCEFNPDTMRNEMVSFVEVALSPFAISKFCHTVTSSWIIGAAFCIGVSCWYLLKRRHTRLALESIKIGAGVGLTAALLAAATGHKSGMDVAEVQPMKLAAMEALYDGGTEQGLKLIEGVEVPYALSIMATNNPKGYVPGINDILNGYTTPDGRTEPAIEEKMERGQKAIQALAAYRQAKATGEDASAYLATLNEHIQYFGYGYIKDKNDVVPPVWITFWSFRIMVAVGCLFIVFFAVMLAVSYRWPKWLLGKRDITALPAWHYVLAILLIPLAYIGSESGWLG